MKKYLLTASYLLVLVAIYHHPITLPQEGQNVPSEKEERDSPVDSKNYALKVMAQKAAFLQKKRSKRDGRTIIEKEQKKTY